MDFRADSPDRSRRTVGDRVDDVLRAAAVVGGLDNIPRHFGVHDDPDPWMSSANCLDLLDRKTGVDGTVSLPEDHPRTLDLIWIETSENLIRIPHDHLVEGNTQLVGRVAAQMLIREEQDFFAARQRPFERRGGVGGRADRATVLADERFDRRCRVDVGDGHDAADPHLREVVPACFELIRIRHVGHRAAGSQVGKDHLLVRRGQYVSALRHEMDAAKHDVVRVRTLGNLSSQPK